MTTRIYATPEIKRERAYQRAEAIERALAPAGVGTLYISIDALAVIADAWEEAGFHGWAENYRAEIKRRQGRDLDRRRRRQSAPTRRQREEAIDQAIQRQSRVLGRMTDERAGQLIRHMQVYYLGHKNGYEPGGPKHDPVLWAQVYRNAGEWRDPDSRL